MRIDDLEYESFVESFVNQRRLLRFFELVPKLQQLAFASPYPDGPGSSFSLRHIVGDLTWPCLSSVEFEYLHSSENDLIAFLSRHSNSLQVLVLSGVTLLRGEWDSCFTAIAGKFPNLNRVSLSLPFFSNDSGLGYQFFNRCTDDDDGRALSAKMEKYLIHGGELPVQPDEMEAY